MIGAKFAQVIAVSSLLETRLSGLLAMLSGGGAEVTLAMFLAVNSSDAQRAMLRSAAEVALKGPEREVLTELLDDYRSRARERNKIAHGVWATSPDVPDALLLVRSADMAAYNKEFAIHANHSPFVDMPESTFEVIWRNCMIYRERDFDEILNRLVGYDNQIIQFWQHMVTAVQEDAASALQGMLPLDDLDPDPLHQEG